jgi:two-component system, NtrC family, sensor histidine kinase HydH
MAHELRNPHTSIKMMVQTATDAEPVDLAVIEDEVRRMERTIQTCLDFARPQQPHRCELDLRDVVAEACRLVEGRRRRQHLTLTLDQPDGPLTVSADRHQLHQVLVNLLLNAMDSVGPRGRLGVSMREVPAGGEVAVHVWDDGGGIPGDLMPTIFDPFVSTKETGTGLGLSISRQIIESHGGRIEARNRIQGGAEFTITLQHHGGSEHAHAAGRRRRAEHPAVLPQGVPG